MTVTAVPPAVDPEVGETELTDGGCGGGGGGVLPFDAGRIVLSFFNAPGELFK